MLTLATPVALLMVAGGAAFVASSFRSGLEYGFLALFAALMAILAVAVPEGAHWARTGGIFILDGDAPPTPLTARTGALDALRSTLTFGPPMWLAWPVIGSQLGTLLRRRLSPPSPEPTTQGISSP